MAQGIELDSFSEEADGTDDNNRTYLPPQDGAEISDWTPLTITETAPAGTVSAKIILVHVQLGQ